jgi:hypothetical protein
MKRRLSGRALRELSPEPHLYHTRYHNGGGVMTHEETHESQASRGPGGVNGCTALLVPELLVQEGRMP